MKRLIVDTCIWYACFDKTDSNYQYAEKILSILEKHELIMPFPTLYETINTRFVKNKYGQMANLLSVLNRPEPQSIVWVEDNSYRERAMEMVRRNIEMGKSYSLVDMIIRLMMEDVSLGPIAVLTFNVADFIGVGSVEVINPISL